jgi:predicted Zn-dependent peptidase
MDNRDVITLPNGARIVFDAMPGLRTASVGVYLGAGARHESADRNGLAHFLEHMAFKGAGGLSARGIAEAVEARGAAMNAATDYERTSYFVRCLSDDAPQMLDIALSLVFATDLPSEEIEREKFVVLQEIGEAADQPDDLVMELAQTASFPDHPLGRPILGIEATLKSITRDDLISFAASAYVPRRTVVSVAGAFDKSAVEAVARRWLEPRTVLSPKASTAPGHPRPHAATVSRKLEQTHLVLAHPAPHAQSDERFAARIFAEIFGGGMASRLFQDVRESKGLAYTIDAGRAVQRCRTHFRLCRLRPRRRRRSGADHPRHLGRHGLHRPHRSRTFARPRHRRDQLRHGRRGACRPRRQRRLRTPRLRPPRPHRGSPAAD